ncbi:MAG: threonine synthase [Lachnospiraceae bacterium]|nr:threonine synthase [Lachnospiraceae bacterium]
MSLYYKSTRDDSVNYTASMAILKGLSDDGGLFVPSEFPKLDVSLEDLAKMDYKQVAYEVMKLFLTDFTKEELMDCIDKAYDSKFDTPDIAPLVKACDAYYLELFHGATIAFKDMALSILPHLLTTSAKKNNVKNDIVILTATSGDTGKAAMAGFADVPGTKIIVFYPKDGVSKVQEKQMVTQKGNNTYVVAIEGNFDDAQTGVKNIFSDKEFAKEMDEHGLQFSSANSINIGRLVPQIVYYVYAYTRLVANNEIKLGDKINAVVPTGNFGNILAAFYAKNIGLPINKLICASNDNKVLYDFFSTGTYDRNREFILTMSPSMDILISSNLERLLYIIAGSSAAKTKELMDSLKSEGKYSITDDMKSGLADFYGNYAKEAETAAVIKDIYDSTGYIIDTHTAVAATVYKKYVEETSDKTPSVIASTASPYKFAKSVLTSIDPKYADVDDFELFGELNRLSMVEIPNAIKDILEAKVLHNRLCTKDGMKEAVKNILF